VGTRERIAVIDADPKRRAALVRALAGRGVGVAEADSIEAHREDLSLVVLRAATRAEVEKARTTIRHETAIIAAAAHAGLRAEDALGAGAIDFVASDASLEELVARVETRLHSVRTVASLTRERRSAEMMLELTQALSSAVELRVILFMVVSRIAEVIDVDRVSIVLCGDDDAAYVVAASDDRTLRDLPIRLSAYPEIVKVLETGEPCTIEDASRHPLFELAHVEVPRRFRALTLFPISFASKPMGVLFLRFANPRALDDEDRFVLEALANATGIALRNASMVQSLREQSLSAHREAQKQTRALQRYADLLDASADGILVMTREGEVLFCNPAACRIAGRDPSEIMGAGYRKLFTPDARRRFAKLRQAFGRGEFPRDVDLPIRAPDGSRRVINVNFSPIPDEQGVVVSVRDVTSERSLARELTRTKEFLQSVIDSSVDAIVSADMEGQVLIYNPAAQRTYGHPAADVLGKMNVRDLYPDGVASEIMRLIRSRVHGPPGVLEDYETEILGRDGTPIPVSLSASLIIHRGRAIGSVGVFTDLRAKKRIEAQLEHAQQELQLNEQKAFIAELAGATAHELNQPLTTVMGYAGMLERQLGEQAEEPQVKRALSTIVRETERMAEIVRKIGKLTKYESKAYVGDTKIIDIERSVDSEPPVTGL
jgi:PAS domain S-box-containing protein